MFWRDPRSPCRHCGGFASRQFHHFLKIHTPGSCVAFFPYKAVQQTDDFMAARLSAAEVWYPAASSELSVHVHSRSFLSPAPLTLAFQGILKRNESSPTGMFFNTPPQSWQIPRCWRSPSGVQQKSAGFSFIVATASLFGPVIVAPRIINIRKCLHLLGSSQFIT